MIYLRHNIIKSNGNFFMEGNGQNSVEIGSCIAEEGTLIGWYESYGKKLIWFAYRKNENVIRILVMDNHDKKTAYIDLEDELLDSEVSFVQRKKNGMCLN